MDAKIIVGWCLLVAGVLVIAWAINASHSYFTAQAEFPEVFKSTTSSQAVVERQSADPLDLQAQMQESMNQATKEAIGQILPQDGINKMLNVTCWSIFAAFMVYAGFKIAEIGVKMLKT